MKCFNSGNFLIPWITSEISSQPEPLWSSKPASSAAWRLASVDLNSSIGRSDFKVTAVVATFLYALLTLLVLSSLLSLLNALSLF